MNVVVAKGVSVVFDKDFKALDNVSAEIPSGQIVGFIGPSGAGKTTLIRGIVGRQRLTSGSLAVLGQKAGSAPLRQAVSYMTQETSVYSDLTVAENLRYFATMVGIPRKAVATEVKRLLKTVDLTPQADQLVMNLSGGQKQRVSLAIALTGKPRLLVLDEPTGGLDPLLRDELWKLFHELAADGCSLIISSHVMDEAERCDELLLIRDGKILAQGSPRVLCERTGTETVEQSFLKLVGDGK